MKPQPKTSRRRLPLLPAMAAMAIGLHAQAQQPAAACSTAPAEAAIARHDYSQAQTLLSQLLAANPTCPDAHYQLAYLLLRQNHPQDSLAQYTAAAQLRTPTAEDLRNVALDYVLLDDLSDAAKWASRALELNPADPESWYALGRIRYTAGNLQAAHDCFQRSLQLAPTSVKAHDNLGLALEGLNRPDEAIAAYRQAIALQQNSPTPSEQPLLNLAILLLHRAAADPTQLSAAQPLLLQAVAIAPRDPKIHEQLGQLYTQQNDLPNALLHFEQAIALSPGDARLHFLLGQTYRRLKRLPEAQLQFAEAARLNGTHSTPEK